MTDDASLRARLHDAEAALSRRDEDIATLTRERDDARAMLGTSDACGCVARVNRGMARVNARLECASSESGELVPLMMTTPLDPAIVSETVPVLTATFCPFCGRKMLEVTCRRN